MADPRGDAKLVTPTRTRIRLLLVEDSDDDAQILLRELSRGAFDVVHRRVDTEAALAEALRDQWDLVISDFSMPTFDGLRAFDAVRRADPDVPFLFVSGVLGEARAVEAMRAGARDYLVKGDLGRLTAAVRRELAEAENRKRRSAAERALEVEERRFRSIFESATVGIVETDLSAVRDLIASLGADADLRARIADDPDLAVRAASLVRVRAANRAATKMLGGGLESARALVAHPAIRDVWIALLEALQAREESFDHEFEIATGVARTSHILLSLRFPDAAEDFDHVVASLLDVTERRGLEKRMQSIQRMETVGRLAGGIAHDFNNILVVIGVNASFLLERHPEDGPEREEIQAIRDAGERAARLTHQLLAFSRRQTQEPRLLDVNDVVREMEGMLRRLIGEDVALVTTLDKSLGAVRIDRTHLEQVVMNLVVNARDAMPRGGTLEMKTSAVVLEASDLVGDGEAAGTFVLLTVTDDGVGMDEETRLRIFEPFFTTKDAGHGTGLGLSTVYGIVRQSGGFIRLESQPGRGTVFRVYLPVSRSRTGRRQAIRSPAPRATGHETILLVEDETPVRRVARRILEKAGYRILEAQSAEDALALAASHAGTIHLVLTDVVMPGMSGGELAERLTATRPDTRVLYMSGYASEAVLRHGVAASGASHLEKPFSPEALVRRVRDVLDARPNDP